MPERRGGVLAAAVTALACVVLAPPAVAAPATVLDLELDEPAGARVAVDTGGGGHDGAIGSHVVMDGAVATFDYHSPTEGIAYHDEHLIVVPDAADGSLDPGRGNFSVEVRFEYSTAAIGTTATPNLLQKGQSGALGGQVKLQFVNGRISCTFKTPQGSATATSAATVADGTWHVVRCDRTPTSVTVYVDGVRSGVRNAATGRLDNTKPWALGGKEQCDARHVDCDYFAGAVDYVRLTRG
ncbi:MAG: LamG-like jellyroll fold domain-containing protein [Nocardioides sp.]